MSFALSRFREKIVVDKEFAESLAIELHSNNITGGTILLAADEILLDPAYVLSYKDQGVVKFPGRYDIVVVANHFDSRGGLIDLTGTEGNQGTTGNKGQDAADTHDEPGTAGDMGGTGGNGGNGGTVDGNNIKVICNELLNLNIISNGGHGGSGGVGGAGGKGGMNLNHGTRGPPGFGGPGGAGGAGGAGGKIEVICNELLNIDIFSRGGAGGAGGKGNFGLIGGHGGNGGNGGKIEVSFGKIPNGFVVTQHLHSEGGGRGQGSDGGQSAHPNPSGPKGDNGALGINSNPTVKQVEISDFWQKVRSEIGTAASNLFGLHLVKVGEYYYRLAEDDSNIKLAMRLFQSALILNPNDTLAQTFINQILSNQNVLGLDRKLDLIPKFEHFDDIFTRYFPIVKVPFDLTLNLIQDASNFQLNKQNLKLQVDKMKQELQIFDLEIENAKLENSLRTMELDNLNERIEANKKEIEARQQELENSAFGLLGFDSVWDVAITVGTFWGGTATLFSAIPYTVKFFVKKPQDKNILENLWEKIKDAFNWKEHTLSDDLKDSIGGLETVSSASKFIVDKALVLKQIFDGTPDPKMQELLEKTAELAFEAELSQIRVVQSGILTTIAETRKTNAVVAVQDAEAAMSQITNQIVLIGQTARTVVLLGRKYLDIVLEFLFKAARSLEIFTYRNATSELRFDFGHVHPDFEEDVYSGLSFTNGKDRLTELFTKYSESWSQIASIIKFRQELEGYEKQGLQRDIEFISLESGLVQEFKNNHKVRFVIKLEDLPANRFESKVVWVSMGLIGATSTEPFSSELEHFGSSKSKLRDGSMIDTTEKPRKALAPSATTLDQFNDDLPNISAVDHFKQGFWGRSPATTWFLSIEEDVFVEKQIDLSALSEIKIAVIYESFLQ